MNQNSQGCILHLETYYDLLIEILTLADLKRGYELDSFLQTESTHYVFDNESYKTAIQLIANACACSITFDRFGKMYIKRTIDRSVDFNYTFSNILSHPTLSRLPQIRNIISSYQTVSLVDGKVVYETIEFIKNYNSTGEDLLISNILIDNPTACERYCDDMYSYYKLRNSYSFTDRGNPQLDILDEPTLDTDYLTADKVTIIEQKITFNGALSGSTKVISSNVN